MSTLDGTLISMCEDRHSHQEGLKFLRVIDEVTPGRTGWPAIRSPRARLRRGIFPDVEELIVAIGDYVDKHNDNPNPLVWTTKASDVSEKVQRARGALDRR
jgi:hypothetical protein